MSEFSFANKLAVSSLLPRLETEMADPINIGFLAPLSGPVKTWGYPGLLGCQLWVEWINRAGGLLLGGRRYPVKMHAFDCQYDPDRARKGAMDLVLHKNIKFLLTLGGDSLSLILPFLNKKRVLTTTLLPSDLSPDTPYLIAPSELHPLYVVTGVQWLASVYPNERKVALCSQIDALGDPSLAAYRAAFAVAGIDVVKEIRYSPANVSVQDIVDPMMAEHPDVLCWCTSHTPLVHAMTEYAYEQGFSGRIMSCTLDGYNRLISRTSSEFMEGSIFQFPDFDDPLLAKIESFFLQPQEFYQEYRTRFPDEWSAVSWEYVAALEIWLSALEKAESLSAVSLLAAMKQMPDVQHTFGRAQWWGEDIYGISNALVGDWPVVQIQMSKARIVEFSSIGSWLERHSERLKDELAALNQLWQQRLPRCPGVS